MPYTIRSGINTWHCLNNVQCNDVISAVFQNQLSENMKAVANTGVLVANFSNGMTHGRIRPFNGWCRGKNQILTNNWTSHMVEFSQLYDSYVLQFEGKLGDLGGGIAMQWANFRLVEPVSGVYQRLGEIKLGVSASPIEFHVSAETITRVRISGTLDPTFFSLCPAGKTISMDFKTLVYANGGGVIQNVSDDDYWSGIRSAELKFFNSCQ